MPKKSKKIIIAIAAVALAVAIPLAALEYLYITSPHRLPDTTAECVENLRVIDGAVQSWGLEHHKTTNDVPRWEDIRPYFAHGEVTNCPQGGTYTLRRTADLPTCSIPGHELPTAPK